MLHLLPTDTGGMISPRQLLPFGGEYSMYVKLWRGGVGSPRMVYLGGVPAFDALRRDVEGEIAFLTLEELRAGLLFRLNINQRIACAAVRLDDVVRVSLLAHRVRVRDRRGFTNRDRIVHHGDLQLELEDHTRLSLRIIVREFNAVRRYFAKGRLRDRFGVRVSDRPVEKDCGEWMKGVDGFL